MLSDQSGEQGSGMYLPWLIGGWGAMGWGPSGLAPGKVAELVFNPGRQTSYWKQLPLERG